MSGQNFEILANIGLWLAYILLFSGILLVAVFVVREIFDAPKRGSRALIALCFLLVLFLISFFFATPKIALETAKAHNLSALASRFVGAGLSVMYILFTLAVIAVIVSETATFKRK